MCAAAAKPAAFRSASRAAIKEDSFSNRAVIAFRDWLLAEAGES
jgi:hypothetical protein